MVLNDSLKKIETLRKEWDSLQPLQKEHEDKLWQKFRLEWNYNSNHIEGNTLTYTETQLLLIFDKTTGDHELREYEEMKAHDIAIHAIREWANDKDRELTEGDIRNLNKIILVRPFWKDAFTYDGQSTRRKISVGEYKKHPNSVRLKTGEMFHYATPDETPKLMHDLILSYRKRSSALSPLLIASELHYQFVRIHPFDDGNGRVARLLVNYVLMQNGFPPIVIRASDKNNYLTALQKADAGDKVAFYEYMAEQFIWSMELAIKAGKGESIEEPEDLDKKIELLEKELAVIDPDEEIKMHFSSDVFFQLYDDWIGKLLLEVIPTVQKFNKLFTGISHMISFSNVGANKQFVYDDPKEIVDRFKVECWQVRQNINLGSSLYFNTGYGTLKKGGLKTFGCNYGFEIKFEHIKYEIAIDEFTESPQLPRIKKVFLTRLLHKPVLETEMKEIAKKLGDTIYRHIDFYSKQSGLR